MKVYMIQALYKAPYYAFSHSDVVRVHPTTILPKVYLSKEQALARVYDIIENSTEYECPIIIESRIEE